jgi:uncharacterized membrane protein
MLKETMRGAVIAAAVGALFAGGARADEKADKAAKAGGDSVKCAGINECKGHGSCAGADNSCKGQNGCKGQGLTETSSKDCKAKGGKIATAEKAPKAK